MWRRAREGAASCAARSTLATAVLVAGLALAGTTTPAAAQAGSGDRMGPEGPRNPHAGAIEMLLRERERLDLTEEQVRTLEALRDELHDSAWLLREEMRESMARTRDEARRRARELARELRAERRERMRAFRERMEELRESRRDRVRELLSEEQREEVEALLERRHRLRSQPRGPRGPSARRLGPGARGRSPALLGRDLPRLVPPGLHRRRSGLRHFAPAPFPGRLAPRPLSPAPFRMRPPGPGHPSGPGPGPGPGPEPGPEPGSRAR